MRTFTQKTIIKIFFLCSLFLTLFSAQAQAPQKMSYQAVVRNAANVLIANTLVGVKISVLQTTASGTVVYSERHTPTSNANGLATFEIGGGTILSGTMAGINWANGPYFIKTETDPTGGTNYTISGTSQLASVPYALFAANGGTAGWGLNGTAGTTATNFIGTTDNTSLTLKTNNTQAMIIEPNGYTVLGSGVVGPIIDRFGIEGNALMIGAPVSNLDNGTLKIRNRGQVLQQLEDQQMNLDGEIIQTTRIDDQGSYAADLKINPLGGDVTIGAKIGVGTASIVLQNKLQIGNPPGFSGNDIAIGNGTQAMSLFQSPTASTFFTNTNFAFLPASGIGNVGIGVTDPQSTLTVAGSTASAIKTITSSYTATDKDHTIIVNMQDDDTRIVTIDLPSAFQSIGRTYVIRGIALPNTVFGSGGLKCKYEREDNAGEDEPGADHSGYIAIRDSGGYLLTSLYKFSASQSQPLGTSDYMAGLLFPPSLLFASPQSYHAQQRTCITVQSTGVKWIVVSENFTYFRDTQ